MSAFLDCAQDERAPSVADHARLNMSATNSDTGEDVRGGKLNKSTQSDLPQSAWRYPCGGQRSRPMSLAYLSTKQTPMSESSFSTHSSRSTLYPVQSELVLSSRTRHNNNRYVSLDMRPIGNLSYPSPYTNSQILGNSAPYTCCCTCTGSQVPQPPLPPQTSFSQAESEDHDGPESLSWRRLHMSRAKLKATATTSELLSGFAMVAMVELQINEPTAVPEWLFVMFAVCTTFLVSVHIFALMISTYLLPNIEAISKLQVSRLITESPHERMRGFIELAWVFSTILGLFLFLVEVAILCWVKFWDYSFTAATASTVIVIPVLIVFVAFAVHFYHSLVVYKCESAVSDMKDLESIKRNLDNVTIGQTSV
ncbi:PREDICTED: calcium release-activated calcium channel protein 1-like isoform X1 [Vollenhovia emeryi]|uniref:calcium release-activated calcium channel protein 1-like isoform X1 n=1 Tax=Vollenhovia emeryi TaxID=411798 RepID=UPI0005F40771|nr:PREDICTED: calcium release-activated calcium channel protein 1-like isoform X1 [Vollenhovia emeryi]XP_011878080.1 PREDICTED: calcium release-activated calcium channel protein 1-like isoform X1 [Vollenhovia emeryi]XP_011878081.1 PREDICTED: calcium release-activated calcium channel protein 1-like isoform X1 [Vollenhovia emeryi]XP_011878082.1 PREDICTED: calcium release-activated calcium channel protein 1-like isoform X1 [Vollenhovia emeryi]